MGAVLNLKVLVKKGLLGIHLLKGATLPKREPTLFLGFRVCISNNYRGWNCNVVMFIEQLPLVELQRCHVDLRSACEKGLWCPTWGFYTHHSAVWWGCRDPTFLALRNRIDGVQRHLAS